MDPRLNLAPCGYLSFRDDGIIDEVNATLLDMLGFERDELVGRHVETVLTVGARIFYQTHWFPLLRLHGRADEIFLALRDSSGEMVGALVNSVRQSRDGRDLYDCVLMRVRERQKYEDALLRARRVAEEAKAALEGRQEELETANARLRAQTVELQDQQRLLEEQATELELVTEELRTLNEDLIERGQEAERLRTAAEEANRAKSSFLAVMSHELRTPLNAIAGYVEILSMGIQGPVTEAQRDSLARIARSQRHLLRLINDVLNLARIEAGRVDYEVQEILVEEAVASVAPMIEPQLEAKSIRLTISVEPGLRVMGDLEKLQQILLNLLSNAGKFTPSGGRVRLETRRAGPGEERARVEVSDTGIGVAADKLESIFHPFVQVDVSPTRAAEGSGLGLAISRDLARGMGGDLTARSTLGEGSTFVLELPVAPVRQGGAGRTKGFTSSPGHRHRP